jgi:hypothetical protein
MTEPALALIQAKQGQDIATQGQRLTALERQIKEIVTGLQAVQGTLHDQAAVLGRHEDAGKVLAALVARFGKLFPPGDNDGTEFYNPACNPRWWELEGDKREEHVDRIREWVDKIYRPTFETIAARLPQCWEEHPLCLTVLDVMAELHKVLYLQPVRTTGSLSGQAELLSRLMPTLAKLMTDECKGCQHQHVKPQYARPRYGWQQSGVGEAS